MRPVYEQHCPRAPLHDLSHRAGAVPGAGATTRPIAPRCSTTCASAGTPCRSRAGRNTRCRCAGRPIAPVYQQHVRECRYMTYRQHVAGIPGAGALDDLHAGLRAARARMPLHGARSRAGRNTRCRCAGRRTAPSTSSTRSWCRTRSIIARSSSYQVPVKWTTCRPVYQQHVKDVPCVTYRTVIEQCEKVVKTLPHGAGGHREADQGAVRRMEDGEALHPGRDGDASAAASRARGCFDPCTCRCRWCPGETVTAKCSMPGPLGLQEGVVPARGRSARSRCCKMVPQRALPRREVQRLPGGAECTTREGSATRPAAWCTEEHCKMVTCQRCVVVPEVQQCRKVCWTTCQMVPRGALQDGDLQDAASWCREQCVQQIPYTTCRMVRQQHCKMVTQRSCITIPEEKVRARSRTRPAGWCPSSTARW